MNNENVLISIRAQIWPPKCPFAEFCWLNVLLAVCRTIPDLVDILCDFSKKTCAPPDLVDILCDFYKQKHVQSQISLTFVCDFSSKIIMWDIIDILCDFSQQRVIICNLRSRWHSLRLFSTTNNVHPHAIPLTLFATFSTMNHVHMFARVGLESKQGMVWSRPRHIAAFPQFFSQLHVRSSANAEFSRFISSHFGVSDVSISEFQ